MKTDTGDVVWTAPGSNIGRQAPVIAGNTVLMADDAGVHAFERDTGKALWTTPMNGAAAPHAHRDLVGHYNYVVYTMLGADDLYKTVATTTMAAAMKTNTLVITAADGIHTLSLTDGKELWKGVPAQAIGRLREPIIVGSRVYVVDNGPDNNPGQGALMALDAP